MRQSARRGDDVDHFGVGSQLGGGVRWQGIDGNLRTLPWGGYPNGFQTVRVLGIFGRFCIQNDPNGLENPGKLG